MNRSQQPPDPSPVFRYFDGDRDTERDLDYLFERFRDIAAELAFAFKTESMECWTRRRLTDMIRLTFGLKRTFLLPNDWNPRIPLGRPGLDDNGVWEVMEAFFAAHGKELIEIFKEEERKEREPREED